MQIVASYKHHLARNKWILNRVSESVDYFFFVVHFGIKNTTHTKALITHCYLVRHYRLYHIVKLGPTASATLPEYILKFLRCPYKFNIETMVKQLAYFTLNQTNALSMIIGIVKKTAFHRKVIKYKYNHSELSLHTKHSRLSLICQNRYGFGCIALKLIDTENDMLYIFLRT